MALWLVGSGLVGCTLEGGGTTDDIEPLPSTPDTFPLPPADLTVTDDNVNDYDATWLIPTIGVATDRDIYVSWDGVTSDAYGETWDPATFPRIALFDVAVDRTEAQRLLGVDALDEAIDESWVLDVAGATDIALSDFPGFDPIARLVPDPGRTWLIALCAGTSGRLDIRAALILNPDVGETGFFISIPGGVTRLDWVSKFDGDVIRIGSGYDAYPIDWSAVTTNAYGEPFDPARADELFVGRYEDVDESDDLASRILDLGASATGWWTAEIPGGATSMDALDLTGTDGGFAGFEGDVVYLVGARCTTCFGAAPQWVIGLDVTPAP